MRRMYSEQELTNTIKAVFEQELEDGALDDKVSDAVDAYLVENPVDITALEGQDISCNSVDADATITGAEIIEKMSGYSLEQASITNFSVTPIYSGAVKNGNKLTLVFFASITRTGTVTNNYAIPASFKIPSDIGKKLYPFTIGGSSNALDAEAVPAFKSRTDWDSVPVILLKENLTTLRIMFEAVNTKFTLDQAYLVRYECTLLLSENFVS